jgi:hypothetical protein
MSSSIEHLPPADQRLAALGGKRDGQQEMVSFHVLEGHALGHGDFAEDALVGVVRSVRPVHHEAPGSTGPELEYLEGAGEPLRSPPPCEMCWVGERSKDAVPWGVDQPRMDELAISRRAAADGFHAGSSRCERRVVCYLASCRGRTQAERQKILRWCSRIDQRRVSFEPETAVVGRITENDTTCRPLVSQPGEGMHDQRRARSLTLLRWVHRKRPEGVPARGTVADLDRRDRNVTNDLPTFLYDERNRQGAGLAKRSDNQLLGTAAVDRTSECPFDDAGDCLRVLRQLRSDVHRRVGSET